MTEDNLPNKVPDVASVLPRAPQEARPPRSLSPRLCTGSSVHREGLFPPSSEPLSPSAQRTRSPSWKSGWKDKAKPALSREGWEAAAPATRGRRRACLTLRQLYMQMDIQLVSIFSTTDSVRRSMSLGFLAADASMRSTSSSFMMLV